MSLSPKQRKQWQQANALFEQFLEQNPNDPRQWMECQTDDAQVRDRLKQLLDAHASSASPLDQSVAQWMPQDTTEQSDDALTGRRFGQWVLLQALGRGGMATVYKARRNTEEFDQVAAIKLLNVGLTSSRLREHFNREQQILARLQHPHIAGLLDAGVADDGTPFIVMEFVDGQPIDQFVAASSLNAAGLVKLFLQVCDAAAFAQQNLIVHRDIKPSNIMVDSRGEARLLDFGIARLVEDQDSDATTTRAFTPGYAAPEQRAGRSITTATDVFGLGMVLFELLTGSRANTGDAGELTHSDLAPLRTRDAELANIVAMAVRPEPERRYASAAGLAQDLRLWQQNRPTVASPDSVTYRLGKYLKRHRVGVTAAALVAAIGIAGITSTAWQARKTRQALLQANANAEQAQAVQNFLIEMFDGADPWTNQNQPLTANDLLDSALEKLPQRLGDYPLQKASVMQALSRILRNLGRQDEAAAQAEQSAELFQRAGRTEDAIRARLQLAGVLIDDIQKERSEPLLQELIASTAKAAMTADNLRARMQLARLFTHTGKLDEQSQILAGVLEELPSIINDPKHAELVGKIYATVAENHENLGQYSEAFAAAVKAESWMVKALGAEHAAVADTLGYQSTASFFLGHWDAAENAMNRALAIMEARYPPQHPSILWARYQLGRTLLEGGRFARAMAHYEQFYQLCVQQMGAEDPRTIMAQTNLGLSYQGVGRLDDARGALANALPLMAAQSGDNPKVGIALTRFASVLSELGDSEQAEQKFDEGLAFIARTAGNNHPLYARGQILLAEHQLRHGHPQLARQTLEASLPVLVSAYGEDQEFVWITRLHLGLTLAALRQTQDAGPLLERAIAALNDERYQQKYQAALAQARQVQLLLKTSQ